MDTPRYRQIQNILKEQIQHAEYEVGDYLPSENELCTTFHITRTTARKALDELQKEGFVIRQHGKGTMVRERRTSLGLLTVKGFSEAVSQNIETKFIMNPHLSSWDFDLSFKPTEIERQNECIHFSRLRYVDSFPVMVEDNWLAANKLPNFINNEFIQKSFFKTLSQHYLIEIIGSEQELRSISSTEFISNMLKIEINTPILHITVKYLTSIPNYFIYSQLFCNTDRYPIGNSYLLR